MTRQTKILLLTILTLCEISCLLFARYSVPAATIIYTLSGLAMSIIALSNNTQGEQASPDHYGRYTYFLYIAGVLLIANWITNVFRTHIYTTPLDIKMSDMLLFIREMSQRYLSHQHVYDPITSIYGSPVQAVYLPAFWLPYTIPLSLGIDMRWASLVAFVASILIAALVTRRQFNTRQLLLLVPVALFSYLVLSGAVYYLMFTQEAIVLLYVTLLCWALTAEYWILAGIAAALCVMSRYFIVAPLLAAVIWLYSRDPRAARKAIFATLGALIVILTVSGSWSDVGYFFKIPFLYVGLLNDTSSLEAFRYIMYYGSVGFASFLHGDSVRFITIINLAVLLLVPFGYFLFAYRYLSDRRNGLVILCGLKFFLVLFLTTLSHPYAYVLYTSSLVSIMLLRNELIPAG